MRAGDSIGGPGRACRGEHGVKATGGVACEVGFVAVLAEVARGVVVGGFMIAMGVVVVIGGGAVDIA